MEHSVKQDLVNARAKHYLFKSKMIAYVEGSKEIAEEILADFNACVLGKWINDTGRRKYSHLPEMQTLDLVHQKIHKKANEIISLKKSGDQKSAEQKLADIDKISNEIMDCLDILESKLTPIAKVQI